MTQETTQLLPCPFTGKKPQFRKAKRRYCQIHGDPLPQDIIIFSDAVSFQAQTKEEATKKWNTRADTTAQEEDKGEISDGHHTFNELYEHRHILFLAVLMAHREKSWRSKLHSDGTMFDGWFIAGIDTDFGQATYHLPIRLWELFGSIKELDRAPEWDGHTSDDVIIRIRKSAQQKPDNGALVDALRKIAHDDASTWPDCSSRKVAIEALRQHGEGK